MFEENTRHLNFNKFLEERTGDINKFVAELELDTKKKGHQSLPKSIRRRAMSHNRFRIPHKLRQIIEPDLIKAEAMQKLPKCRKHIRKRRHLIMAYQERHGKNKWLSTHLWAAKRMRIINSFGYKIPFTPNDKCFRSAYRHFRHNCCLVDLSYYQCLTISGSILPTNIVLEQEDRNLQFDKANDGRLYADQQHKILVCPLFIIKRISKDQMSFSYCCLFHPACLEEAKQIQFGQTFQVRFEANMVDIYALLGPQSINIAENALQKYGFNSEKCNLSPLRNSKNKITYIFQRQAHLPIAKPIITNPNQETLKIQKNYKCQHNERIRAKMQEIFTEMTRDKIIKHESNQLTQSMSQFWKYFDEGQNRNFSETVFQITTRSRYTHKRKNKFTKQEKKRTMLDERIEKKEINTQKDYKQVDNQQKVIHVLKTSRKLIDAPLKPVLISNFHKNQMLQGCLIFCSSAESCKLWRILTHLNVKLIGRRQYLHTFLQSGCLSFPEDFSTTQSFLNMYTQKKQQKFAKFSKLPGQKRPHYFRLNSPFPFGFSNDQLLERTIVQIEMVSKGRCFQGSYICRLNQSDLPFISKALTDGKMGIVCSQVPSQIQEPKAINIAAYQLQLSKIQPIRKIIGVVTSGGYLFSQCKQGGIGFIDSPKQIQSFGSYVLVRKPSSLHYMLAEIKRLKE